MDLPEMTPLQALVITILLEGEQTSGQLAEELVAHGVSMRMTSLYRLMGRMEVARYVCGRYRQYQLADGRTIRERSYRVSETGFAEWGKTRAYYATLGPAPGGFQPVPMAECYDYE
jgi:hypothetical protein